MPTVAWPAQYRGYDTRSDVFPGELAALAAAGVLGRPGNALDLACGHGTDALYLARLGWNVRGVDRDDDDDHLLAAKRRRDAMPAELRRRIVLQRADVLTSGFLKRTSARFDLVLSRLLINNLVVGPRERRVTAKRVRLVEVAAHVAKRGGVFVLRTTAADRFEREVTRALRKHFEPITPGVDVDTFAEYTAPTTESVDHEPSIVSVGLLAMRIHVLRRRAEVTR